MSDRTDVNGFLTRAIGSLIEYDAQRGTELVRALETYYAAGGNLSKAKDALHIHVNTVVQRLDRIAQLLGADWNSPGRALEDQLSLQLHRLTAPMAPPSP
ncbi:CdaR family transcriptional regulator [Streptomyces sp. ISL-100]|uniref:PucR family transcriptional regulator n=1 Tax=Streptomyces sp. ISL-100 TaxID=2819173 RepID=UPI00203531CF|nr:helix-turn-helix domain-containing protein [Streptomyces sp. ISL-100]